jgi:hypothetical protein
MKKGMFAVLFAALVILQAAAVFAAATSMTYTDPLSMAPEPSSVVRSNVISRGARAPCNVQMTVSPRDPYFIGRQRTICVNQNKGNLFCQQQCIDKMKLTIIVGSFQRQLQLYSAASCTAADPAVIKGASSASKCYSLASDECAKVNTENDYCRRKCIQNAYAICRQNIAAMRYH